MNLADSYIRLKYIRGQIKYALFTIFCFYQKSVWRALSDERKIRLLSRRLFYVVIGKFLRTLLSWEIPKWFYSNNKDFWVILLLKVQSEAISCGRNYGFNFNGIPLDRKFGWISASSGAAVLCNMKQKFCFEIFWLTKVVSEKLIFFSNGSFFLVSFEAFLNSTTLNFITYFWMLPCSEQQNGTHTNLVWRLGMSFDISNYFSWFLTSAKFIHNKGFGGLLAQ